MREKGWRRFYRLDIRKLAIRLLRPGQQLVAVRCFTSRVSVTPANPHQHRRQNTYLEAIATENAGVDLKADLAWHVRAWGRKVLAEAREELAHLYPTYAEWQPLTPGKAFEPQPMRLIEPDENGVANADTLNTELGEAYLQNKFNPH
jgi:hypothetical protein